MSNQRDVADLAGVSMMTVSRVINGNGYVKEETRERVFDAIKKLEYYPNNLGRSLNNNRVNIIAVLAPLPEGGIENDPYFTGLLYGIEMELMEHSYDILLSTRRKKNVNGNQEFDYFRPFMERKADALILMGARLSSSDIETIGRRRIPFCVIGDRPSSDRLHILDTRNKEGFKRLMARVHDMGHREIAFFGYEKNNSNIIDRYEGYREFLNEHGIKFSDDYFLECPNRIDRDSDIIESRLRRWLGGNSRSLRFPSVIACSTDSVAISVVSIARRMGIDIPSRLCVTGFDGIPLGQHIQPRITTMLQPLEEMGATAARLTLNSLEEPEKPCQTELFNVSYLEGESLIVRSEMAG